MAGIVECGREQRCVFVFQFLYGSIGIKEKKWVEDSTAGAKRDKESLVSFSGDDFNRARGKRSER